MLQIGSLVLVVWVLEASTAHSGAATTLPPSSLSTYSISSCPARTINYITHTLPQQCLRTSRSTLTSSASTTASLDGEPTHTASNNGPVSEATPSLNGTTCTEEETSPQAPIQAESSTSSTASADLGPDSPLDDSKFLSFEQWKKQNLAKLGQSPDNVGGGRGTANAEGRRRPIKNALDSLGDEGEIEIDFSGFGGGREEDTASGRMATGPNTEDSNTPPSSESPAATAATAKHRSKDAGKTCKERFNYASFDCAATILKTNPRCKSSSAVLSENKDSYMLNECSSNNKFLIVELCDDILVDTLVLANYEFFSSMFRTVRVSISDRYPVKAEKWRELGTFEARNTREVQAFLIENPLIWARYLRIEFLTHYGNEFYCPVSLVRVHGTTMMEEVRRSQEDGSRSDEEIDDDIGEPEVQSTVQETQVVVQAPISSASAAIPIHSVETEAADSTAPSPEMDSMASTRIEQARAETSTSAYPDVGSSTETDSNRNFTTRGGPHKIPALLGLSESTMQSHTASQSDLEQTVSPEASSALSQGPAESPVKPTPSSAASQSSAANGKASEATGQPATKVESKSMRPPAENAKAAPPSASQPQPAQPTTQESFFKSTSKRLAMLETNSSLNIQYIEEQSRILRDAFIQTEKQQLRKTENFLLQLNDTVMAELKGFRQQYDQLWQSTVIELETNREQSQLEMLAISSRLTIMADELVFQKRMIVVQSTLLLLCLGLIIFVRSGSSYMELPRKQQMMNKSHGMLKLSFDSPPESPPSRRTSMLRNRSRRLVRTSSGTSGGSVGSPSPDRHGNARVGFLPPAPRNAGQDEGDKSPSLSPGESRTVRETRSGPATPSGTREHQQMEWDTPILVADSSLRLQSGELQSQGRQASSLRCSGGSEIAEDVNGKASTTDVSAAKVERRQPQRVNTSSGNSMSSFDGDTAAEFVLAGGLSNGD